jgi:hypothetical protein
MNIRFILTTIALFATTFFASAQKKGLIINPNINLPKYSIESEQLIASLNSFLTAIQLPDEENEWVLSSEKAETELLTDEMNGMDKCDSINFKPYLINVEALADKKTYRLQVSYMGVDKDVPVLRAIFELLAHKTSDAFLFSSPLLSNTKDWKTKKFEHLTFHYQDVSAENVVNQWAQAAIEFDKKLKISPQMDVYFCNDCNDMTCIHHLIGIDYKLEMNGIDWIMTNFTVKDKEIVFYTQRLSHTKNYDAHDLFHWRTGIAIPNDKQNHYMICGCAYIYAGSWGISWEDIQKMFHTRMKYDKKTDWLKLYFDRYNFGESQEKHLLLTQYINALIIQKTEKEQGFEAVRELLASGNIFKNREHFFSVLEKVTGINEKNFNKEVWKLINNK